MFPKPSMPSPPPVHGAVRFEWRGHQLIEVHPTRCPIGEHEFAPGELLVGWSAGRRYDCLRCDASWIAEYREPDRDG